MADPTTPKDESSSWAGRPQAVYRLRGWIRALQWFSVVAGLIGSLFTLTVGLWRWTLAYTHYGPAVVWRWSLPWLLVAIGLSPAVILGILSMWRTRGLAVALYPSGLIYRRRGRRLLIPWQEIQQLTLAGPWSDLPVLRSQGRPAALILQTESGDRIRLTHDLGEFEDLVAQVKDNVYPRMHRAYAQAFNRGQPLHFGPLSMDQEGVQVARRKIPWRQVLAAELHRGNLCIRLDGAGEDFVEIATSRIPNADLCVQMIQSLTEGP